MTRSSQESLNYRASASISAECAIHIARTLSRNQGLIVDDSNVALVHDVLPRLEYKRRSWRFAVLGCVVVGYIATFMQFRPLPVPIFIAVFVSAGAILVIAIMVEAARRRWKTPVLLSYARELSKVSPDKQAYIELNQTSSCVCIIYRRTWKDGYSSYAINRQLLIFFENGIMLEKYFEVTGFRSLIRRPSRLCKFIQEMKIPLSVVRAREYC